MLPLRSLSLVFRLPQLADDAAAAAAAADDDATAAAAAANDDAAVAAEVAALVADAAAGDVDSNFVVLGYHITGIPNAARGHAIQIIALARKQEGSAHRHVTAITSSALIMTGMAKKIG